MDIYQSHIYLCSGSSSILVSASETKQQSTEMEALRSIPIQCVYGLIQLQNLYICYVEESKLVAKIHGSPIYQAIKFNFHLVDGKEIPQDKKYIQMMQTVMKTRFFYFSDQYDLTNSM
jgi:hypothetical protein